MRILPAWLREFVDVAADDRQLAEDLTSAGIAVESVAKRMAQTIYEMDLTTNRVDAMNHYGVAREASAIYNVALKPVAPRLPRNRRSLRSGVQSRDASGRDDKFEGRFLPHRHRRREGLRAIHRPRGSQCEDRSIARSWL